VNHSKELLTLVWSKGVLGILARRWTGDLVLSEAQVCYLLAGVHGNGAVLDCGMQCKQVPLEEKFQLNCFKVDDCKQELCLPLQLAWP
jgi:hypothetical protein